MKISFLSNLEDSDKRRIMTRSKVSIDEYVSKVKGIVDDIKENREKAILKYTEKFDGVKLELGEIEVSEEDFRIAYKKVGSQLVKAIEHAIDNLRKFHEKQLPKKIWFTEVEKGIFVGLQASPLSRVGLYIPAGKGRYPSVVPMLGVPAKVVGVDETILCTPPINGFGDPATLVAANMLNIDRVFRIGGVPAISALAFGTTNIPKVDKIVGPGGPYVSAAKTILKDEVAFGTPAGPSEVLVLADETAQPRIVAAELLVELEHGPDSSGVVVTTSMELAKEVKNEFEKLLIKIPEWRKKFAQEAFERYGAIIVCNDMNEAIYFVNEYSPEHLLILSENPLETCYQIKTAGAVFLGTYSSVAAGCYLTGSNAILPTAGAGKTYSATTIYDFLRFQCVEHVTKSGLKSILKDLQVYTEYEGFPSHKLAAETRFTEIE